MNKKPWIRFLKSTGIVLAVLSIIYTLLQILSYFHERQNKLEATCSYYSLQSVLPIENGFMFSPEKVKETVKELNRFLKDTIAFNPIFLVDTADYRRIENFKKILGAPGQEELNSWTFIHSITISNISDEEVHDIKVDLFSIDEYGYGIRTCYVSVNSPGEFGVPTELKKIENKGIVPLGSLLPREKRIVTIYGLSNPRQNHPRIIYPGGFVNAYFNLPIETNSFVGEITTSFIGSSKYLQVCLALFSLLGIFYFLKLSYQLSQHFFKKQI